MNCELCGIELAKTGLIEGTKKFCCAGCQAVYKILSAKGVLENYRENPVFLKAVSHGLISNPALLDEIRQKQSFEQRDLQRHHFEIGEMWCPSCAEVISWILLQEAGVKHCVVDYATDLAFVDYSPFLTSKEKLYELIRSFGYLPASLDNLDQSVSKSLYLRFGIAGFCALNSMMFASPLYATYFHADPLQYGSLFAFISLLFVLPVITYSAWQIFRRAITALWIGVCGMELLVSLGVTTAFALSLFELWNGGTKVYFDSLSVIVAFVLLGKIIEAKAKFSAKKSLIRLFRNLPRKGRKVMEDGSLSYQMVKELSIGDSLAVFTGEKIVLDGVVTEGEGACDESLITGEAIPVVKRVGDKLISGSILTHGMLKFRATASMEHSLLHQIFESIQLEISHKTVYVRAVDNVVKWFVPVVVLLAATTAFYCVVAGVSDGGKGIGETAWVRAASILLISCPCAIGIAAPLAESSLMQRLASLGVIVRNRGCLAVLGKETVFVFDKTGTLTEGQFTIQSKLDQYSPAQLKALKGLVEKSIHPISVAIAKELLAIESLHYEKVEEIAGKGIVGWVNNDRFCIGSELFLQEQGVNWPETIYSGFDNKLITVVYFAANQQLIGRLELGDQLRPDATQLNASLAPTPMVLLSGDADVVVESVANRCGFHSWRSRVSPLEKSQFIEKLRNEGEVVCMIGDGINDAPALAAAQIGISMVSASEISIQISDILLTTNRLSVIHEMRRLARKGQQILNQNLFWAFIYNAIGIGLAIFGLLTPVFAAIAMIVSSLMVLGNATRVR